MGGWPEWRRWGRVRKRGSGVGIGRDVVSGAGSILDLGRWHDEDEWVCVRLGAARCVPAHVS